MEIFLVLHSYLHMQFANFLYIKFQSECFRLFKFFFCFKITVPRYITFFRCKFFVDYTCNREIFIKVTIIDDNFSRWHLTCNKIHLEYTSISHIAF